MAGENNDRLFPASGFVAACSKLIELTVISPYPRCIQLDEAEVPLDPTRKSVHSAISELVVACKALPDFNTFQIVRIPTVTPHLRGWNGWLKYDDHMPPKKQLVRALRGQTEDLSEWAMDHLKKSGPAHLEGKGRERTTLRVINLSPGNRSEWIEEYVV